LTNIDNELHCYCNEFHSHLPFDRLWINQSQSSNIFMYIISFVNVLITNVLCSVIFKPGENKYPLAPGYCSVVNWTMFNGRSYCLTKTKTDELSQFPLGKCLCFVFHAIPNGGKMWFRPAIFIWRVYVAISHRYDLKSIIEKLNNCSFVLCKIWIV
jgi:hypothetical protein